jgi:two-component system phosphate regulon sensor histidine kinase PhoR
MADLPELRALIDGLDEPSLIADHGRVLVANRPARELLGQAIEGRDVRLAIRHPTALEHILHGRAGDAEISGIGGPERPWLMATRRVGRGLLLVRLTDRSVARAAEKMRVDFVANASHELRTPLATILGYAETIADAGDLDAETNSRFARVIGSEAKRMLRVVEDLMSLSRIEADRFIAPTDLLSPAEVVSHAAERARPLANSRQCTVELEVEEGLPQIRGDKEQLLQLLDNLIANALRYGCTNAGCTVRVSARQQGRQVVIGVADSGEGIAKEHLPRLTQRFYRVDEARSRDAGGTGLGLAIVKHIVERHRGSLDIRSSVGKGTHVLVALPLD